MHRKENHKTLGKKWIYFKSWNQKLSLNTNNIRNKQKACTKVTGEWLSEQGHAGIMWIEFVIFCDHWLTFKVKLGPYACNLQCTENLEVLLQTDNPLFIVNHMGLILQVYVHIKQDKILFAGIFHSADFFSSVSATCVPYVKISESWIC